MKILKTLLKIYIKYLNFLGIVIKPKVYLFELVGFFQLDEGDNICICGNKIRNLEKILVEDENYDGACDVALKILNDKYSPIDRMVQIW
jgi:hypothetical protein